jgi:hypothetical protein
MGKSKSKPIGEYLRSHARICHLDNFGLAIKYYKRFSKNALSSYPDPMVPFAKRIAECVTDIPIFYRKHNNLDGLQIPGIGPKMKKDLLIILENESG